MRLRERLRGAWLALKGRTGESVLGATVEGYASGRPLAWPNSPSEQVAHYKHWVFAAVRAIRDKAASAIMALEGRVGAEWKPVRDHPFLELMARVNPVDTRYTLLAGTVENLELTGNAYWYVVRDRLGVPREIWPLPSYRVKVIPDRTRYIAGYSYTVAQNETIRFQPDEIVHFRFPNPGNLFYGWSPLQAAAEAVDAHEHILTAQCAAFANGVQPPKIVFSTPDRLRDESVMLRLAENIRSKYAGTGNANSIIVTHAGLTAKPLSLSPQEMDFLNSARATRDVILAIYGVPPIVVGLAEDVNRSSGDAMERIFARNIIAPKLQMMAEQIQQDLFPAYPAELRLIIAPILPEDRAEIREDATAAFDRGAVTRDELRVTLTDRQPLGDDTRMEPLNMVPVGTDREE